MNRQHEKMDADKKLEAQNRVQVINRVLLHAVLAVRGSTSEIIAQAASTENDQFSLKQRAEVLRDCHRMTMVIPMHELLTPELVDATFLIQRSASSVADYLERFCALQLAGELNRDALCTVMRQELLAIEDNHQKLIRAVEGALRSLS